MNPDSHQHPELSGWWFAGILAVFASLIGIMIAANVGAIRTISLYYLMGVFVASGAMLTTLIVNAVGLGRKWDLARQETEQGSAQNQKHEKGLLARLSERNSINRSSGDDSATESNSLLIENTTVSEDDSFMARRRQPRRRAA